MVSAGQAWSAYAQAAKRSATRSATIIPGRVQPKSPAGVAACVWFMTGSLNCMAPIVRGVVAQGVSLEDDDKKRSTLIRPSGTFSLEGEGHHLY